MRARTAKNQELKRAEGDRESSEEAGSLAADGRKRHVNLAARASSPGSG